MTRKLYALLSLVLVAAFVLAACGAPATYTSPGYRQAPAATDSPCQQLKHLRRPKHRAEKVTVTWWHISTKDPGLSDWQKMADDYMAAHPNVTIEITVLENEAFKTKLTTVMQSGEPPDIFQSWGGGVMNEQANAGLLKDITADLDADGGAWRNSFAPGALGVYCLQGQELRRAVGYGHGRFLVQQGPVRQGWHRHSSHHLD